VPAISVEGLRQLLRGARVSWQRTRTWKTSPDPDYEAKAARVLRLYRAVERGRAAAHGVVVVCVDECGPLSLRPWPGSAWRRPSGRGGPGRPTTARTGVRYLLGSLDVGADRLHGGLIQHKDRPSVLGSLKRIRARYPHTVGIFVVMDNLSAHWTPQIRAWARTQRVRLVPVPTYASYLNRIECHFWAYVEFVIRGSDYHSHAELVEATRAYLRHRKPLITIHRSECWKTGARLPDTPLEGRRPARLDMPPIIADLHAAMAAVRITVASRLRLPAADHVESTHSVIEVNRSSHPQPLAAAEGRPQTVLGHLDPGPLPVAAAGLVSHEGLPGRRAGGPGPPPARDCGRSGR
jgi:transposase